MSIEYTLLAQAVAFKGTAEQKIFQSIAKDTSELGEAMEIVTKEAEAYVSKNANAALFLAIEAKTGKKLTKPQRELLLLTLEIQNDGTNVGNTGTSESNGTGNITSGTGKDSEPVATEDTDRESGTSGQSDTVDKPDTTSSDPVSVQTTELPETNTGTKGTEPTVEQSDEGDGTTTTDEPQESDESDPLMDAVGAATPPQQDAGVEDALAALGL